MMDLGAEVHCLLTPNAAQFVTPLTFQVLSRNPVHLDTFEPVTNWNVKHVSLAESADLVVICPATANVLGKLAGGLADNLLTSVIMAAAKTAPVLICPAMNPRMWENPIVQANVEKLKERGYQFVEPGEGKMACDDWGRGRLAEPSEILAELKQLLA